jgi:hypothetical protein
MSKLGMQRECGACSLCCTGLRVDPLRKLGGVPCARLGERGGCSIHANRPDACRAYRCLWLQGSFEEADRPDKLGAVIDLVSEGGEPRLAVREAEPGAVLRSPRLQAIVDRHRAFQPVRISHADGTVDPDRPFQLLLPGGEDHRVEADTIRVFVDNREVRVERRPVLDRWLHGLSQRLRALRLRGYDDGSEATSHLVAAQEQPRPSAEVPDD